MREALYVFPVVIVMCIVVITKEGTAVSARITTSSSSFALLKSLSPSNFRRV